MGPRVLGLAIGGVLVALELFLAPQILAVALLLLAGIAWRQGSRPWPVSHSRKLWTTIVVAAALWMGGASFIVALSFGLDFEAYAAVTAPRIVPWTPPELLDKALPALALLLHGLLGTLGLALVQFGARLFAADSFKSPSSPMVNWACAPGPLSSQDARSGPLPSRAHVPNHPPAMLALPSTPDYVAPGAVRVSGGRLERTKRLAYATLWAALATATRESAFRTGGWYGSPRCW